VGTPEVLTVGSKNLLKMPTYDEVTNSSQVVNYWNIPIKLAPNTTYYMSSHYLNDYTSKGKTIYVLVTADATANTDYATIAHKSVGIRDRDLTTDNSGYLYFRVNGGVTRALYEEMLANTEAQLELGSAATPYEPYREPQTATVPDLFAVGDYRDEVDVVAGTKTRRALCVALTSDLPWFVVTGRTGLFGVPVADGVLTENKLAASSHYVGTVAVNADMPDNTIKATHASALAPGKISIYVKDTTHGSSLDTFKAWLDEAGVIAIAPLVEPVTESITPQELSTVKGVTVIYAATPVAPVSIAATYLAKK
jgi:hypothetical protein